MDTIISQDVENIASRIKDDAAILEGKNILVTGGSGFLGGYFLDVIAFFNEHHFTEPCKIICLDNLIVGDPSPENIPTPETYRGNVSFTGPRACYDESKRLGETLCMAFWQQYGLPVKIARPFNFYGPGLRLDDKRVLPDFVNNVLHNKPIVIHSDGKATRTFCYISDAIAGLFKILLSDFNGEAFNVGNDTQGEISMLDLAKMVQDISGKNVGILHKASLDKNYVTDNPQRRAPDLSKIRRMLNYQPSIDLKTGLQKSIAWYKDNYHL